MIERGDVVLAGISGGADSVCLLHCLRKLREKLGFTLHAIHVHHGIRGEEADTDERFVGEMAARENIPYKAYFVDDPALAAETGKSEEGAGRMARAEAFSAYIREELWIENAFSGGEKTREINTFSDGEKSCGINAFSDREETCETNARRAPAPVKIALAHHRDDSAETVLYQLSRGSGLAGLAGIRPVQKIPPRSADENTGAAVTLIRPLLWCPRGEIERYLAEKAIPYRTDRTNLTDAYARNRIRHHVLPYLEAEVHEGAAEHIAETALLAGEALDYIEKEAAKKALVYIKREAGSGLLLGNEAFLRESPFMTGYLIRHCLKRVAPHQQDITRVHIAAIRDLSDKQVGKSLDLPGGIKVRRTYDGIQFFAPEGICRKKESGNAPDGIERRKESGNAPEGIGRRKEGGNAPEGGSGSEGVRALRDETRVNGAYLSEETFSLRCETDETIGLPIPEKTYTKWIDFAIISDELCVRTRRPGDFITVHRCGARKKISDYMIDAKIPREVRDQIPLVADGQEIVWIPGYRLSERYKVTPETKTILKMEAVIKTEAGEKYDV